jgi:hypothetical protein
MKRLVWSLLITGALFVSVVPEASAHGSHYRGHVAYDRHHIVRHGHHYPYWLRRNADFHRWYRHSHYRNDFYLSWNHLFDIYRFERRYHRSYRLYDSRVSEHDRRRHRRH